VNQRENKNVTEAVLEEGRTECAEFSWRQLLGLSLALLLFYCYKVLIGKLPPMASLGLALMLALAFWNVRYLATSRSLAVVLKVLVVATTGYLALTYPYYIPSSGPGEVNERLGDLLHLAWLPSLAFGVLALIRPAFAVVPMTYLVVLKSELSRTSGLPLSQTDYAIIPESALLAVIAINLAWLAKKLGVFRDRPLRSFGDHAFYLIAAIHFANYFYAGYQKLVLDGPLLSWLANQTQNIFYSSLVYQSNPLGGWDSGILLLARLLEQSVELTNILVLAFQLASIVAITRRGLIVLFAVFFDLMHLAIFLATGIFFWKWIILNLVIIFAARRMSFHVPPKLLTGFAMGALVLAPSVFYIPLLGWYDSREINRTTIRAVTEEGDRLELPSNFFRNYSVIFAQNRIARESSERLPTGAYGATWSYETYLRSFECSNTLLPASSKEKQAEQLNGLGRFISGYHEFALRQTNVDGRLAYDYFPHHIWSNPMQYGRVKELDLKKVVGYELVVEGVCMVGVSELPSVDLVSRTKTIFPIRLGS